MTPSRRMLLFSIVSPRGLIQVLFHSFMVPFFALVRFVVRAVFFIPYLLVSCLPRCIRNCSRYHIILYAKGNCLEYSCSIFRLGIGEFKKYQVSIRPPDTASKLTSFRFRSSSYKAHYSSMLLHRGPSPCRLGSILPKLVCVLAPSIIANTTHNHAIITGDIESLRRPIAISDPCWIMEKLTLLCRRFEKACRCGLGF